MTAKSAIPAVAALLLLSGCGYVGDPLPPSLNVPQPVTDLRTIERGDKLIIEFTVPALTTDGVVMRRIGLDLRAGTGGGTGPLDMQNWAAQAAPIPNKIAEPGPVKLEVPARDYVGRELILAVRVAGPKGRFNDWSNAVVQQVVPPLEKPVLLKPKAVPEGVGLAWQARPGTTFRIYRSTSAKAEGEEIGTAEASSFVDSTAEFGKTYEYRVQALVKTGSSNAESEISDPVAVTPVDIFAPGVPTGLSAIPAVQSIEITWDRNTESDLKGYYLYRSVGASPLERIGGLLETPSYSDRAVESGKQYRYAVSAVDQLGNESARSGSIEIAAP